MNERTLSTLQQGLEEVSGYLAKGTLDIVVDKSIPPLKKTRKEEEVPSLFDALAFRPPEKITIHGYKVPSGIVLRCYILEEEVM